MIIEVLPDFNQLGWNVVADGQIVGGTKNSYDADFNAELLSKGFLPPYPPGGLVYHYPAARSAQMAEMERLRNERKKAK